MGIASTTSDGELLAAVPYDTAAFEAFYRRYVRRLMAFAVKRCASAEDAADVVALTFVRLVSAARNYDPALGRPDAFVLGVAANVVRDQQRRHSRHRALLAKLTGRDLLEPDDLEAIESAIDAARSAGQVREALDAIPAGEGDMLRLVAAGQTPGQAADQLGISNDAGRARLSRARRRLRRHLTSLSEEERS